MRSPRARRLVTAIGLLLLLGQPVSAGEPRVMRPWLSDVIEDGPGVSGAVFLLAPPSGDAAVAVGAAHSFDLEKLAERGFVDLRLGKSKRIVTRSQRFLAPPGRSFADDGAAFADDFVVFLLDETPTGVGVLVPDTEPAQPGEAVLVLGIPNDGSGDEEALPGTVLEVDEDRITLLLEGTPDLRGWGGAPIFAPGRDRVVGILEAARPSKRGYRLTAAPLERVLESLEAPLLGGQGRRFEDFAAASDPVDDVALGGADFDDADPAAPPSRAGGAAADDDIVELGRAEADDIHLVLQIDHPNADAIVSDTTGAFITGRATAMFGELTPFDVVFVLDTSMSSAQMTGSDVNGNGVTGEDGLGGLFRRGDPGDSILAAEVAAARRLLDTLDPRAARVGVVTFSGMEEAPRGTFQIGRRLPPAVTEQPLTHDYDAVQAALDRVIARGPAGQTHMAAGVDQATIELLGLRGSVSAPNPDSEKIVLFLTDGQPTLPHPYGYGSENVRAVLRAAHRANKVGITVHTFAIGPEALAGPIAPIELASQTGGDFTPIRDPRNLIAVFETVNFVNLDDVEVRNLTTGSDPTVVEVSADGTFAALIPLELGRNRIEITARASDGQIERREFMLQYAPDVPTPEVPPEYLARRNRLLRQRLVDLRRAGAEVDLRAAEQKRKELAIEIEREREIAKSRARDQRRELELDVERDEDVEPERSAEQESGEASSL